MPKFVLTNFSELVMFLAWLERWDFSKTPFECYIGFNDRPLLASRIGLTETVKWTEIERLRVALRRIADLPKQTAEAHTAANTAIEIARDALESARGGRNDGKA
jgi:hypothetical protein